MKICSSAQCQQLPIRTKGAPKRSNQITWNKKVQTNIRLSPSHEQQIDKQNWCQMSHFTRKTFSQVRITQAQISLHIHPVRSAPLLAYQTVYYLYHQLLIGIKDAPKQSNFTTKKKTKKWKFWDKKIIFFSHFCSKHRLWVLVRTASPRRF